MRVILPAIAGLLLLPLILLADDLSITGELKVVPYKLVQLKAKGFDSKAGLIWKIRALDSKQQSLISKSSQAKKDVLEFVAPPGQYAIELIAGGLKGESFELAGADEVVTIGDPPPIPPGPTPTPPGPTPTPVTAGKRWVVIIEETEAGVVDKALIFRDPAVNVRMKAGNHQFRIIDKDVKDASGQVPADVARFITASQGKTLPQVYFVDEQGHTVLSEAMPMTGTQSGDSAAFLALLTKAGG